MALLEKLEPLSEEYMDKLEHIRGAVAHHVYEEENNWFVDLKQKAPLSEQDRLTRSLFRGIQPLCGRQCRTCGCA